MARAPQSATKRRRALMGIVARDGRLLTTEVADRLGVSTMTIRRDLKALEEAGAVVRSYGGAVAAERITFEFEFDERRRVNLAEKRRIGAAAAEQIAAGDTVFLDTGTTTLEIAKALVGRSVSCSVVTSSLVIASTLWGREHIELALLGGRVRRGSPDLVGPATELMIARLTADTAFLGSDGIDPARGSFAADVEAARVAERMAASARRVVVVADASKLGPAGGARYLTLDGLDELITDRGASRDVVSALRSKGVEVTLV